MKAKTAVTALLFLFVAASVTVMIIRGAGTDAADSPASPPGKGDRLVAYYFHGRRQATENVLDPQSGHVCHTLQNQVFRPG